MHSAIKIAKKFVDLANEAKSSMDILKLIKLTYIGHGWMLGLYGRRMFPEYVEAWKYGPVVPELYSEIKQSQYHHGQLLFEEFTDEYKADFNVDEEGVIKKTYEVYGNWTGGQLVEVTHKKGTPWYRITKEHGGYGKYIIPNSLTQEYYERLASNGA